ncbi:MAG: hypothetical protein CO189_00125 [candidate division Zixibacteria bacterium CG_4_9_14_3_um_filter_46_8]|nr:MAG: hypothetical protein CO189_00125 [candidate division Zixibacteria bacterium CG_4_9_14_3_um_filter_46_8]
MRKIGLITAVALIVIALGAYGMYSFANACDKNSAGKTGACDMQSCGKSAMKASASNDQVSAKLANAEGCCAAKGNASGASSMTSGNCDPKACPAGAKGSSACIDGKAMSAASFANVYSTDDKGGQYAVCPVSGESFKVKAENPVSIVDGKGYYHCCQGCVEPFKSDPAKYIEKLNEKMSKARSQFASGVIPSESEM